MRQTISPAEHTRRMNAFKAPTWGFRLAEDGEIERDLFDGKLPKGWVDSPAKLAGDDA